MYIHKRFKFDLLFFIMFLVSCFVTTVQAAGQKQFTVVIDAGHGGKDPGAVGKSSNEKDINLSVALKLGEKIAEQNPGVNVLYTRKTDIYLTLGERSKFANDKQADLFLCIHTNASKSAEAVGAETYTLGAAGTKENLEVAMKENSVILLEDNYEQKYQGFDPNSAESYIVFEFMQGQYIEQSIHLASLVQNQFTNEAKRHNRGVRQAGFLVLKTAAMPSILVELGFISNPAEERYLNSKTGQDDLANAIYGAFDMFKHEYDKKSNNHIVTTSPSDDTINASTYVNNIEIIYKIQIFASKDLIKSSDQRFKGLKNIGHYIEDNIYKYTFGETNSYEDALSLQKEAKKYFNGAFIVSFKNGTKVK
jgi:N-acetylmuramoyl-L-alanine amidase